MTLLCIHRDALNSVTTADLQNGHYDVDRDSPVVQRLTDQLTTERNIHQQIVSELQLKLDDATAVRNTYT